MRLFGRTIDLVARKMLSSLGVGIYRPDESLVIVNFSSIGKPIDTMILCWGVEENLKDVFLHIVVHECSGLPI